MKIEDFISKIEEEFEDVNKGQLKPESKIREHFEWDSVNALVFIAMVNVEYDVVITAEDLQKSETVQDIFTTIQEKKAAA
ncbi:MAG: acyl carrier protein [Bacteroidales bacterium]|nr:acyl carrier protein [Bacteroidales bacterium]